MANRPRQRRIISAQTAHAANEDIAPHLLVLSNLTMRHLADYFYRRLSLMRGQLLAARSNPGAREIHDLRVATRRTTEIFAILALTGDMPASEARSCIRRLRTLRRTAGNIRDADVSLEKLKLQLAAPHPQQIALCRRLARRLTQQRCSAIQRLQNELNAASSDRVLHRWIDHARSMHLHLDPLRIQTAIKKRLAFHQKRFARRSRLAQKDSHPHHIHKARIAAKQWRYLLELIHDIHAAPTPALAAAVRRLKGFQKVAGDLQDAVSFRTLRDDYPAEAQTDAADQKLIRAAINAMKAVI